jgi:hypothetical protein
LVAARAASTANDDSAKMAIEISVRDAPLELNILAINVTEIVQSLHEGLLGYRSDQMTQEKEIRYIRPCWPGAHERQPTKLPPCRPEV